MINKKNIIFGIVCFREKFWDTVAYRDLLQSYDSLKKPEIYLSIYVFDNTDVPDWDAAPAEEKLPPFVQVHYYHNHENPGISAAFNHFADFANKNDVNWIVFLDQDTHLPESFFEVYWRFTESNQSAAMAAPKVFARKHMISPCHYYHYRASKLKLQNNKILQLNNISAINSGLMINKDFFLKVKGYNSRLRVDFCDHEFFERVNGSNETIEVLDIVLKQNFSEETNTLAKSLFRYRIYLHDMLVYRENKNKVLFFFRVDLPHLLKLTFKYKTFDFLKLRVISGL